MKKLTALILITIAYLCGCSYTSDEYGYDEVISSPKIEWFLGSLDWHGNELDLAWKVDNRGWEAHDGKYQYFYIYIDGKLELQCPESNNFSVKHFDLNPGRYIENPDGWHTYQIKSVIKRSTSSYINDKWKTDEVYRSSTCKAHIEARRFTYYDGYDTNYSWIIKNDWKNVGFEKEFSGRVRIAKTIERIGLNGTQVFQASNEGVSGADIYYYPNGDTSYSNKSQSKNDGNFKVMGVDGISGMVAGYYERTETIEIGGENKRVTVAYYGYSTASSVGACLISLYPVEIGEH